MTRINKLLNLEFLWIYQNFSHENSRQKWQIFTEISLNVWFSFDLIDFPSQFSKHFTRKNDFFNRFCEYFGWRIRFDAFLLLWKIDFVRSFLNFVALNCILNSWFGVYAVFTKYSSRFSGPWTSSKAQDVGDAERLGASDASRTFRKGGT